MEHKIIAEILEEQPYLIDFFRSFHLNVEDWQEASLGEFLKNLGQEALEERSLDIPLFYQELQEYAKAMEEFLSEKQDFILKSISILPGKTKDGQPEQVEEIVLLPSQIIAIVGPTGSGKSRLLGDIEWTANGDTQTGRRILINGAPPDLSWRYSVTNQLVAQLSQNMNFVIDATVEEFLDMHADCRNVANKEELIEQIINQANQLAGESFRADTNVTALSGGQSRALMIADTALLSPSPIVLIDEIENAGIDRKKALDILISQDKIVLMATHDPLLCLMADQRIVIKNGGIHQVLTTTAEEKGLLDTLWEMDTVINRARQQLRAGEQLTSAHLSS